MPNHRNLDKTPRFFGLPGDQVIPWLIIYGVVYVIGRKGLGWPWPAVIGLSMWGMATWWLLTAKGMYPYFSRFVKTPHWTRAIVPYQSILEKDEQSRRKKTQTTRNPKRTRR